MLFFVDFSTITVYYLFEVITMRISDSVKALLSMAGVKQKDLVTPLGMKSQQSVNNKFAYDRWDGSDLAIIAEYCGCKIGFILPNGQQILIDPTEYMRARD